MNENIQGTFASAKIAKVRWRREDFTEAKSFLAGSWDNPINTIKYWTFETNEEDEDSSPVTIATQNFLGDVTEIEFIGKNLFVASSSMGFVRLFRIQDNPYVRIEEQISWESLHQFDTLENASCTALATFEQDIASVGEDGKINLLTAGQKNPVRVIDKADSCSICCVDFLKYNEILTGNSRGHMKVWDLRTDQNVPTSTFMLSDQVKTEATSIKHHPTQRHMVVAGGGDGSLTVWDLRHNTYPRSQLIAHQKAISEVLFHGDRPENLFTSSVSGELWQWSNAQNSKLQLDGGDTHWLNTIGAGGKVKITSLCNPMHKAVNGIDVDRSTLLFGCDNEAFYTIKNLVV